MKKSLLILLLLVCGLSAYSQSATTVNLNIDEYDWNKLIASHYFDKSNGIGFQFWYKKPTAVKRMRIYYLRKFAYSKDNTNLQFTTGFGIQGTTRTHKSISYQLFIPNELIYRQKLNTRWSFNLRVASNLAVSPRDSQGDHTHRLTTDVGFRFRKTGFSYHSEYLNGFKAGLRENFQGAGFTYEINKKVTIGAVPYVDLKQKNRSLHIAFTTSFKF